MNNVQANTCGAGYEESSSDNDSEIIDITGDAEEQSDHTDYLDGGSAARRFKNTIHLWEFLLELLADESCRPIITWSRKLHGEFKIKRPQQVASHWGKLKHRPAMNYEKLSRALRHYYSKGIIRKVKGQRLVYRFHKLPYEYTTGKTHSLSATVVPLPERISQDEYKYDGPSPCGRIDPVCLNGTLLDREKMKRFLERRLRESAKTKDKPTYTLELRSPVESQGQGNTVRRDGRLSPELESQERHLPHQLTRRAVTCVPVSVITRVRVHKQDD